MSPQESTRYVEQLIAELDDLGQEIEQHGRSAARHLENAAAKRSGGGATRPLSGRYTVRVVRDAQPSSTK